MGFNSGHLPICIAYKKSPFSGWKRGADAPPAVVSQAQVPLFKGGRRCFRRHPQVADHEDLSLVGWCDSETGWIGGVT